MQHNNLPERGVGRYLEPAKGFKPEPCYDEPEQQDDWSTIRKLEAALREAKAPKVAAESKEFAADPSERTCLSTCRWCGKPVWLSCANPECIARNIDAKYARAEWEMENQK